MYLCEVHRGIACLQVLAGESRVAKRHLATPRMSCIRDNAESGKRQVKDR